MPVFTVFSTRTNKHDKTKVNLHAEKASYYRVFRTSEGSFEAHVEYYSTTMTVVYMYHLGAGQY